MKWVKDLEKQMKNVMAKYTIIDEEVVPGERVVGKVSDELLQLYGLGIQLNDEIMAALEEHAKAHYGGRTTDDVCASFRKSASWKAQQLETVAKLFWMEVRSEFGLHYGDVGIRAHGQVVVREGSAEEREPLRSVGLEELDPQIAQVIRTHVRCSGKPN